MATRFERVFLVSVLALGWAACSTGRTLPGIDGSTEVDRAVADGATDRVQASGRDGSAGAVNGSMCAAGGDCASGNCVEGLCCDTPCSGACYSCRNALTASSPDGTCGPIVSGKDDPQARCGAATAPSSCGNTGHCDGKGACEKFGGTTICLAAKCLGGSFNPASTCDGKGACVTSSAQDCKGSACSPTGGCATRCTLDTDCAGGYCATSFCSAKKIDGSACQGNNECSHGQCVGGICCESPCTGLCLSCASADTGAANGLCKPIAAGGGSKGRCLVDATACGHDGTCDGNGACRFQKATTSCGTTSCSAARLKAAPACDGAGACVTPTASVDCPGGVTCASTVACNGPTCTVNSDCASNLCVAGTCTPKKTSGQTCATANECASGFCADNVCCDRACTGACEACNAGILGTCAFVTGAPRASHESCSGTGPCASSCTGTASGCVFPTGNSCRIASCSGITATAAATCDGAGNCPLSTKGCAPFTCNAAATGCLNGCTTDNQCVSPAVCVNGTCGSCPIGQHACSSQCVSNSSTQSCGTSCIACPAVPNAQPSCNSTACGFTCSPQTLRCNAGKDACEKTLWTFETGVDGWSTPSADDRADNSALGVSTVRAHGGAQSLSAHLSVTSVGNRFRINFWPCGRSPFTLGGPEALNLQNRTLTFWFFIAPDSAGAPTTGHTCIPVAFSGNTCIGCNATATPVSSGQWTLASIPFGTDPNAATATFLTVDCSLANATSWTGNVYVDDVSIQ